MLLLSSADFFQNLLFQKILWVSNGLDPDHTDILSVLIWVQTILQRLSTDDNSRSRERVNMGKDEHIQNPKFKKFET